MSVSIPKGYVVCDWDGCLEKKSMYDAKDHYISCKVNHRFSSKICEKRFSKEILVVDHVEKNQR